jgi:phosphoesterase family protein
MTNSENRSFDHYFGTLRGVRGFGDKQILTYQSGNKIWQQPDTARTDLGYLLPYNLTDQVDGDLDHSWEGDHAARNGGAWNQWVPAKTEETMGYFTRDEIPFQYAVADAFTICDGYHQAIMAPTSPNRMYFWTGTSSGWTSNPNDYEVDFGPDAGTAEVTTYPELLQAAGINWRVYTNDQVGDSGSYPDYFLGDYGDNPLWFYQQYNSTNSRDGGTSQLAIRGAVTPWQTEQGPPPDGHREARQPQDHQLADRSVRLLRRGDHGQHQRRLPPPLRRPHRLNDAINVTPGIDGGSQASGVARRAAASGVARGAAGGPDRLAVVQLDPFASAERLGQVGFRGLDAQPFGVGNGIDTAPGQHAGQRPISPD